MSSIVIIGAGSSGLAAAHTLLDAGHTVTIFEKSRGVGGRAATRNRAGFIYDYGANYIKPGAPDSVELITKRFYTPDLIDIQKPVWTFDGSQHIQEGDSTQNAEPKWSYRRGLTTLSRKMAKGLNIHLSTHVARIQQQANAWILYNDAGEVMGTFDRVLITIPANQAKFVYSALKDKGKVTRGWLGVGIRDISALPPGMAKTFNFTGTTGVLVEQIAPSSPVAGKIQTGDIIVGFNGQAVDDSNQLRNLVAAVATGFVLVDLESGRVRRLATLERVDPTIRMNDGKADPWGRFWAGTMGLDKRPGAGTLYCLEPDLAVRVELDQLTISNGLDWSADRQTMFYVDTPTQRVDRFHLGPSGLELRDRRPFASLAGLVRKPAPQHICMTTRTTGIRVVTRAGCPRAATAATARIPAR